MDLPKYKAYHLNASHSVTLTAIFFKLLVTWERLFNLLLMGKHILGGCSPPYLLYIHKEHLTVRPLYLAVNMTTVQLQRQDTDTILAMRVKWCGHLPPV